MLSKPILYFGQLLHDIFQRWPKLFMRVKFIVENTVMNYTCMRMCLEIVLKHFMILYSKSLYCLYFVVAIPDISIGLKYVEYLVSICSKVTVQLHQWI